MDTFEYTHDENLGDVKISDDVMAICAVNATLRTKGVAGLSGGITDTISKTILGKESLSKGIKINQSEEGVSLDVYVIVDYGVKIPVVAWDIQTNVKNELETMTDRPVLAVNIHVQGVQENDTEEEQK
ncbi:MAG: Asp23/Gls24 family envelope stress response protein [Eubacteriaceae bacterium]|nr:Asp23/Gls24 family envelope stress response protein [Eubacteriaceae bacterium]